VIDRTGKQLGVMETSAALEIAKQKGLDLVEVAPAAEPPVAKLLDFRQLVLERKKQRKATRQDTRARLKEIRVRPNIGVADLAVRAKRAAKFLEKGNRVKITAVYRGREITHTEVGLEKIDMLMKMLKEVGQPEGKPKRKGLRISVVLIPKKGNEKSKT